VDLDALATLVDYRKVLEALRSPEQKTRDPKSVISLENFTIVDLDNLPSRKSKSQKTKPKSVISLENFTIVDLDDLPTLVDPKLSACLQKCRMPTLSRRRRTNLVQSWMLGSDAEEFSDSEYEDPEDIDN